MKSVPRRLTINSNESLRSLRDTDCLTTRSLFNSSSLKRESIIDVPWLKSKLVESYTDINIPAYVPDFPLLRVLESSTATLILNPEKSIHLRYISVKYEKPDLPRSWFKLWNLQTLVIHGHNNVLRHIFVPLDVWTMPSLKHLFLPEKSCLEYPDSMSGTIKETNLHTLCMVNNLEIDRKTKKMFLNVRKLGVRCEGPDLEDLVIPLFYNIVHLDKLEALKLVFNYSHGFTPLFSPTGPVDLAFPPTLTRLTLTDTKFGSWEDMSVIGTLPNLEVLKLRRKAVIDCDWTPIDGQFEKLRYLELSYVHLRHWEADYSHFPRLEILVMKVVHQLRKIPSSIGEIDSLKLIKVIGGGQSLLDSAKEILADQREMGNNDLQVIVFDSQDSLV